jgi:hypothetical protein
MRAAHTKQAACRATDQQHLRGAQCNASAIAASVAMRKPRCLLESSTPSCNSDAVPPAALRAAPTKQAACHAADQQQHMLLNALHLLLCVAAQITSAWHAAGPAASWMQHSRPSSTLSAMQQTNWPPVLHIHGWPHLPPHLGAGAAGPLHGCRSRWVEKLYSA